MNYNIMMSPHPITNVDAYNDIIAVLFIPSLITENSRHTLPAYSRMVSYHTLSIAKDNAYY